MINLVTTNVRQNGQKPIEVKYVLDLKKKLISVGALKAKGNNITIENSTMKFTHEAIMVLQEFGITIYNIWKKVQPMKLMFLKHTVRPPSYGMND